MRVLLCVEPGLNGVFRHVEGLCDFLLEQSDVEVGLAYSDVRSSDALADLIARVERAGGPVCNLGVGSAPGFRDIIAYRRLVSFCAYFRPQIIHAHSSKAGALARGLWLSGFDASYFYTPNAYFGLNRKMGGGTLCFNTIESALGQIGHTINVSESERRFANKRLGLRKSRLLSIPNAVDCTRFNVPDRCLKEDVRKALGIPADAWVFGTVGRYSEQKDPFTLYQAVERVLIDLPDAWFAHLGEGEMFDAVTDYISGKPWADRVCRVRYDSLPARFYQALDTFVLSSRFEGLPISGIEALATGLPLVFTRCPGCEDFAFMGLNGVRWAEIGRSETLVESLIEAKKARGECINHRAVAESAFSPETVYGRILSVYRTAVLDGESALYDE